MWRRSLRAELLRTSGRLRGLTARECDFFLDNTLSPRLRYASNTKAETVSVEPLSAEKRVDNGCYFCNKVQTHPKSYFLEAIQIPVIKLP